jgi:hypothetical protein
MPRTTVRIIEIAEIFGVSVKGSTIRITPPSDTRESDRPARPFVRPAFG